LANGITDESLVRISSHWGEAIVRASISEDQRLGSVFVPMHWSGQFASHARIDAVVNPSRDPVSGQPEFKYTPVRIQPYRPAWHGFVLSRTPLALAAVCSYWVIARGRRFWRYEIAGEVQPGDWQQWAQTLSGSEREENWEWIDYLDAAAKRYRGARVRDARLEYCVFISPNHELPPRSWLAELFEKNKLEVGERIGLLRGHPGKGQTDNGRIVCSCFGLGLTTLIEAIRSQGLTTPEAIGAALKAGTNCGSCVPELRSIIAQV
jgi:assimilatory nitrate reductase catalytic subunit